MGQVSVGTQSNSGWRGFRLAARMTVGGKRQPQQEQAVMNMGSLYRPAAPARGVLAWGGMAALAVLLVLSAHAVAQRFRPDPIEGLRKILRDRDFYDPKPRTSLFDKKEEKEAAEKKIASALKTYQTALERATGRE